MKVGAVSGAALGLLLLFDGLGSGDPFAWINAHDRWTHARSALEVARAFWFGNSWQSLDRVSVSRELFFFLWLAVALLLLRQQRALGVYCLLSAVFLPLQGELINSFRYGATLFSLAFAAGDWLAERPAWLRWALVPAVITVNHWVALSYAKMQWAY